MMMYNQPTNLMNVTDKHDMRKRDDENNENKIKISHDHHNQHWV